MSDDIALIQTVDFFTPIVDDPYLFGQIAAANALSDVYAMGGEPKIALNIVGFPNCLDVSILGDILAGGAAKVREAGAVLVGGHSIQDDEPKYGLCVSGFVHPKKLLKNYGCRPGDVLILTKQIGSGIINTAVKAQMASDAQVREAVAVMSSLNRKAKRVIENYPVTACTDVTGFGLLGHCVEMAEASQVTFVLDIHGVRYIDGALDYARMGLIPAGSYKNREYSGAKVELSQIPEEYVDLLYDPQTSGGLLFSVAPEYADDVLGAFAKAQMDTEVSVIGRVTAREEKLIRF